MEIWGEMVKNASKILALLHDYLLFLIIFYSQLFDRKQNIGKNTQYKKF